MKITNADVIKSGEKDLIDSITADLDWGAVEDIFLKEHNLGIDEDIEYKKGDIVAYENQVAYKLEFTVKVNLSILINRDGEYLSVTISEAKARKDADVAEVPGETLGDAVVSAEGEAGSSVAEDTPGDATEASSDGIQDGKEDRYLEALGQLDPNDPDKEMVNGEY